MIGSVRHNIRGFCESRCSLESFNIDLATSNLYGQVRGAILCLSGWSMSGYDMIARLKTTTTVRFSNVHVYFDSGIHFRFRREVESSPDYAKTEELENAIGWESVMCFGLYENDDVIFDETVPYTGITVDALLVQPSKTEVRKYVRIGIVQGLEKPWFDETAVASTITLV